MSSVDEHLLNCFPLKEAVSVGDWAPLIVVPVLKDYPVSRRMDPHAVASIHLNAQPLQGAEQVVRIGLSRPTDLHASASYAADDPWHCGDDCPFRGCRECPAKGG